MKTARTKRGVRGQRAREAFTLIELMVVVVIIAAIAGLLLPAIMGAITRARIADARAEISQIEGGISAFEHEYKTLPPSSITLYETGTAWAGDPVNRGRIRGIWSRFDFSMNRDFNGDGDTSDTIVLQGDQCLVFFLGGVFDPVTGFHGFATNPVNPFSTSGSATTRKGPFFDFDMSRVRTAVIGVTYPMNSYLDRFPVYFDKLPGQTRPMIYASSYAGRGYVEDANNDGNWIDGDLDTPATLAENPNGMSVYWQNVKPNAAAPNPAPFKPKTYQIISPGYDGKYGIGGPYFSDGDVRLPQRVGSPPMPDPNRIVERDNLTNFESGVLQP